MIFFLYYSTLFYGVCTGLSTVMPEGAPRGFIIIICKSSSKKYSKEVHSYLDTFAFTQACPALDLPTF